MKLLLLFTAICLLLNSCTDHTISPSKDVAPEAIFTTITINAFETTDSVNCQVQFTFSTNHTATLQLTPPSKFLLDGDTLNPKQFLYEGQFYEHKTHLNSFVGTHTFTYIDINGKTYNNNFVFKPLQVTANLPDTLTNNDIGIQLTNVQNGDTILCSINDTADATQDIIYRQAISNNVLQIAGKDLQTLARGPVNIHIYQDKEMALANTPKQGGKIQLHYRLKFLNVSLQ